MIGFHWFPSEHKLKKWLSIDQAGAFPKVAGSWLVKLDADGLHEKRKAGNYQDGYIFEIDLERRSKGPHWGTSEGSFWLSHESTLILREARAAYQASTFTDRKWRWCG